MCNFLIQLGLITLVWVRQGSINLIRGPGIILGVPEVQGIHG